MGIPTDDIAMVVVVVVAGKPVVNSQKPPSVNSSGNTKSFLADKVCCHQIM